MFHRWLHKPEGCEEMIEIFFWLAEPMDYPNLVRGEEKFCNACEGAQVLEYVIHYLRMW